MKKPLTVAIILFIALAFIGHSIACEVLWERAETEDSYGMQLTIMGVSGRYKLEVVGQGVFTIYNVELSEGVMTITDLRNPALFSFENQGSLDRDCNWASEDAYVTEKDCPWAYEVFNVIRRHFLGQHPVVNPAGMVT